MKKNNMDMGEGGIRKNKGKKTKDLEFQTPCRE